MQTRVAPPIFTILAMCFLDRETLSPPPPQYYRHGSTVNYKEPDLNLKLALNKYKVGLFGETCFLNLVYQRHLHGIHFIVGKKSGESVNAFLLKTNNTKSLVAYGEQMFMTLQLFYTKLFYFLLKS